MRIPLSASPDVQQGFRELWSALDPWIGGNNIDLAGRRIINAGIAIDPFDYITRWDLDDALAALQVDEPDDEAPSVDTLLYGTHAQRTARAPGSLKRGTLWWETDRTALYQVQVSSTNVVAWVLLKTRPMRDTLANRPSDLVTNDAGFLFVATDEGVTYRWSGSAWVYHAGTYGAAFSARPAAGSADEGMIFLATDRGYQAWRKTATVWKLMPGWGGPMRGTLDPDQKPGSLGTDDAEFLFYSTDFDRTYRWTGSAWADAPGEPPRRMIAFFETAPSTGWRLCDGTASVTITTATGGTTTLTVPDLTTNTRFVRSNTSTGTGTFGTTGSNYNYYDALPYLRL